MWVFINHRHRFSKGNQLVGRSVAQLVGRSLSSLVGWLVGWLVGRPTSTQSHNHYTHYPRATNVDAVPYCESCDAECLAEQEKLSLLPKGFKKKTQAKTNKKKKKKKKKKTMAWRQVPLHHSSPRPSPLLTTISTPHHQKSE